MPLTEKNIFNAHKVGIVLSGGGIKGMAHIGILKALEEFNISPQFISGASAGALVGVLYAQGASPEDMLNFFKNTPLFKYNFFTLLKPGFLDTDKYLTILDSYFTKKTFETLDKQLTVVATDLENGVSRYFDSGPLLRPVLASAALPPIFSPVRIDGILYSDGGIMDNFPVTPLSSKSDFIIGSYTSTNQDIAQKELGNAIKLATRVNNLMLHANAFKKLEDCDLLFKPKGLESIAILDKKGIDKAFHIGYINAVEVLNRIYNVSS